MMETLRKTKETIIKRIYHSKQLHLWDAIEKKGINFEEKKYLRN
jgi:hypothetical protein